MTTHAPDPYGLTEKEKQTLRLMVRGHDAKSIARHLDLSVHTINERLRDARRKMAVSSSREAARMLFDREDPQKLGDEPIGDAERAPVAVAEVAPENGGAPATRSRRFITGAVFMSIVAALLALVALPQLATTPSASSAPPAAAETSDAIVASARRWLELVDQSRWEDSYRATGEAFRKLNTLAVWTDVSRRVRVPLGATQSRVLLSHDDVPAPPRGYEMVKFRTSFANKPDAVETVSLDREDGAWRVVGVYVE